MKCYQLTCLCLHFTVLCYQFTAAVWPYCVFQVELAAQRAHMQCCSYEHHTATSLLNILGSKRWGRAIDRPGPEIARSG